MQKPPLKIRRATILDTVNLYRLLTDFERQRGTAVEQDEPARMGHILHTISTGFVLVVERAGRICGSIGFGAGGPEYALQRSLVSQWQALPNGLSENYRVLEGLTRDAVKFADEHKVEILFATAAEPNDKLDNILEDNGFQVRSLLFARKPTLEQADEDPEDADDGAPAWLPGDPAADTGVLLDVAPAAGAVPPAADAEPAVHTGEGTPGETADL